MVPLFQEQALLVQKRADLGEDRFGEVVLLEQVPEAQDRTLVGYPVLAEFNPDEAPHGLAVVDRVFGSGIREIEPMLEEVDAEHLLESQRWSTTAALRIPWLDERDQALPRDNGIHLGKEPLTAGALALVGPGDAGERALICHRKSRCGGSTGWTEKFS